MAYKATKLVMQVMNMICYIYLYIIITSKKFSTNQMTFIINVKENAPNKTV